MSSTGKRRWLLLDKSALVRVGDIPDSTLGELCICAITRLEMLHSARSAEEYRQLEEDLAVFHELHMNAETLQIAVGAHRELGEQGHHRLPIPDLLIAACAQQHQAAVLHFDRHYDVLTGVLAFEAVRLDYGVWTSVLAAGGSTANPSAAAARTRS